MLRKLFITSFLSNLLVMCVSHAGDSNANIHNQIAMARQIQAANLPGRPAISPDQLAKQRAGLKQVQQAGQLQQAVQVQQTGQLQQTVNPSAQQQATSMRHKLIIRMINGVPEIYVVDTVENNKELHMDIPGVLNPSKSKIAAQQGAVSLTETETAAGDGSQVDNATSWDNLPVQSGVQADQGEVSSENGLGVEFQDNGGGAMESQNAAPARGVASNIPSKKLTPISQAQVSAVSESTGSEDPGNGDLGTTELNTDFSNGGVGEQAAVSSSDVSESTSMQDANGIVTSETPQTVGKSPAQNSNKFGKNKNVEVTVDPQTGVIDVKIFGNVGSCNAPNLSNVMPQAAESVAAAPERTGSVIRPAQPGGIMQTARLSLAEQLKQRVANPQLRHVAPEANPSSAPQQAALKNELFAAVAQRNQRSGQQ